MRYEVKLPLLLCRDTTQSLDLAVTGVDRLDLARFVGNIYVALFNQSVNIMVYNIIYATWRLQFR